MDAYPPDYVAHNLPLLFLSGLGSTHDATSLEGLSYPLLEENGHKIRIDLSPIVSETADRLLDLLLEGDGTAGPWNGRGGGVGLKIRNIGRSFTLPPRKANSPPISPSLPSVITSSRGSPPPSPILHSPLSPLTPAAPTFPDGVMTPLWVSKYEVLLPSALIVFCPFTTDRNMSLLRDNQLKTEINGLRSSLESSKYKLRLVVVLMADESAPDADLDERINTIRRATNFDSKNSFYSLPARPLQVELKEFAKSLFLTLQPSCVEYYRDLSKHARRKRNRSSTPPPTAPPTSGTSQVLSVQGWNVRYEFKLGVFAEFRQEMDAAFRNYESAYEGLLGQDVFESIAGWSPRFNDTRLLADVIALRAIRCLLWNSQTTTAVRWWKNHRSRMQDLVDRRGKGSNNYGWEAWEARWAVVMAEMLIRVDVPSLTHMGSQDIQSRRASGIYAFPEKAFPIGERLPPWCMLHHPGYWFNRAAEHEIKRKLLADQIPEEDRSPPGHSPASQIASKAHIYDTYLAPEPHVEAPLLGMEGYDHAGAIQRRLTKASEFFARHSQNREANYVTLKLAKQLMKKQDWEEAYGKLLPLWKDLPWRKGGWLNLVEEFDWALRECAVHTGDAETLLQVDWELMNKAFGHRPSWNYEIGNGLMSRAPSGPKPSVVVKAEEIISCVSANFAFIRDEGNVGEPIRAQIVIVSNAHKEAQPIIFSELKIVFEGGLRQVHIVHDPTLTPADQDELRYRAMNVRPRHAFLNHPSHPSDVDLRRVPLEDRGDANPGGGIVSQYGKSDLTFCPRQVITFTMDIVPREAGDVKLDAITLLMDNDVFSLALVVPDNDREKGIWMHTAKGEPVIKAVGLGRNVTRAKILPKPPKMRIEMLTLKDPYYTDEAAAIRFVLNNEEDEEANVKLEVRLIGGPENAAKIAWDDDLKDENAGNVLELPSDHLKRSVGMMRRLGRLEFGINFSNTVHAVDYELEITATYTVGIEWDLPLSKSITAEVAFVKPFEAPSDMEFMPLLSTAEWPNYSHIDDTYKPSIDNPLGLQQRWMLKAKMMSFANEGLTLHSILPVVDTTGGDIVCTITPYDSTASHDLPRQIYPEDVHRDLFIISITKVHLEDRRAASVNLNLSIRWARSGLPSSSFLPHEEQTSFPINTSTIPIPRFTVPMREPRVLLTAEESVLKPGVFHLQYHFENPSPYFLSFEIRMETNEDFAFSGPKTKLINLTPVKRQAVDFNIVPFKRGVEIRPELVVVDTYFQTQLKVQGIEGELVKYDKNGILLHVPKNPKAEIHGEEA